MKDSGEEGYIVEFIVMGNAIKVTAMDPKTLTEVSIVGSAKASQQELAQVAVRKLHYVLSRDEED